MPDHPPARPPRGELADLRRRGRPTAEDPNPGIAALNELRALSGLAPVSEDDGMTNGARRHSEYMVRTGT